MKLLIQILQLLSASERRRFAMLAVVALVMAVSTTVGIAAIVPFFAVLGEPRLIHENLRLLAVYNLFGFTSERAFLIALGGGFVVAVLLANTVNLLGSLAMQRYAHRAGKQLCVRLFDEYLHRSPQFHATSNTAVLSNNVLWEANRGTIGILQFVFSLTTNLATVLLIVATLVAVNPLVATALCGGLGFIYVALYLLSRRRLTRNGVLLSRHTEERVRVVNESFGAIKQIAVGRVHGAFNQRFLDACEMIASVAARTQAIAQSPRYLIECAAVGGLVGSALYFTLSDQPSGAWLAQITFLGFAAYRLLPALQQIFHAIVGIRTDRTSFETMLEDLRQPTSVMQPPPVSELREWRGRPWRDISLHDVSFAYQADGGFCIAPLSIRMPAGATIGLMGRSGSGKTTLVDLIAGALVPTAGTITIDDIPLNGSNRACWQATLAYVPQDVFLLDASVADNIAFGTEIDIARVRHAARQAQLDTFVATLEHGYEQIVGERGARLSGGQRQRIGIARALYRSASVLILDEATNALDGLTEQEVLDTLERIREGRTVLLIAHRPSTLRRCDFVLEMTDGSMTYCGTYTESMRRTASTRRPSLGVD